MKVVLKSLIFTILSLSVFAQTENRGVVNKQKNQPAEKRTALVIGNGSYADSPLENPANDANDMAQTLKTFGFEVFSYTNLDQNGMKKAIREFGAKLRTKGGIGLFYYAGHGVQVKGTNYMIPVGAQVNTEEEVEYESVEVGLVLAQMESASNNMNFVILDACRNNPFARSFRSAGKGLASIDAPSGTLLAYSTAPGSVASDGKGRNGLYTQELLKAISTNDLSIEDVFKQVRVSVRGATAGKQTPWESSSLTGDFYFNPSKTTVADSTNSKTKIAENLPSAEQVLEKYFQAIGGKAAIQNLKSFSRRGEIEFSMYTNKAAGTILETWKAPNKSYIEVRLSNGELSREGFDGTTGWLEGSLGFAQMDGQQLEVKKRSSTFNALADVAGFKRIYPKTKLNRKDVLNGREVFVVEAEPVTGKSNLLYFDGQTGLLARLDYFSESVIRKGTVIPTQVYFDEYTEINGVMMPLIFREANSAYTSVIKFNWITVKSNISIDDAVFQMPKDKGKTVANTLEEFDKAEKLILEASQQAAQKNYDEAIKIYAKVIEISPKSERAYNQRGNIYILLGRFDEAIADYSAAVKINPFNSIFYFNRGMAHYKKNAFNSAVENFSKAIELTPDSVMYYSSRCAAFLNMEKNGQALIDCTKAIEIDATKASLYLDRAVVYERMGSKNLADIDRKKYKELGGK